MNIPDITDLHGRQIYYLKLEIKGLESDLQAKDLKIESLKRDLGDKDKELEDLSLEQSELDDTNDTLLDDLANLRVENVEQKADFIELLEFVIIDGQDLSFHTKDKLNSSELDFGMSVQNKILM